MQFLRVLTFSLALVWVGSALLSMAQAQSPEVLQERITQHDRQLQALEGMQLGDRLARLETQVASIRDDIGQIKQVGLAVSGAIFLLVADKLFGLLGIVLKGGKQ